MKTNIDIKNKVFEILNVSEITDYINGTLYNGKRPVKNDVNEDIVLTKLPVDSEFVQTATINVNCYAKDIMEGVPNEERLNDIFKQVLNRLQNYTTTIYFDVDIASQDIMDSDFENWSFLNVRLNCKILKN